MKNSALKRIIAVVLCLVVFAGSELTGVTNIVGDLFASENSEIEMDAADPVEETEEIVLSEEEPQPEEETEEASSDESQTAEPADEIPSDVSQSTDSSEISAEETQDDETEAPADTEGENGEVPVVNGEGEDESAPVTDTNGEEESENPDGEKSQDEEADSQETEASVGITKDQEGEIPNGDVAETEGENPEDTENGGETEVLDEEENGGENEEEEPEAFDEEYKDGQVIIRVEAEPGVVPNGTELSVKKIVQQDVEALDDEEEIKEAEELNAKYEDIQAELELTVADDDTKEIAAFVAYDVNFLLTDEDGVTAEIEPDGEVSVSMEFEEAYLPEEIAEKADQIDIESIDVIHMEEAEEDEESETGLKSEVVADADVSTTENAVEKAEFTTGSGKTFVITWMENDLGEREYVCETDDATIKVTAAKGVVPDGALLKVVPILADNEATQKQYQDVEKKLLEKAESEAYEIAGFLAYDISFTDEAGAKLEPNGEVKVAIDYKKAAIPEELKDLDSAAYAQDDTDEAEEGDTEQAESAASGNKSAEAVSGTEAEETSLPESGREDGTFESGNSQSGEAAITNITIMHLEENDQGQVTKVVDMGAEGKVTELNSTKDQKVTSTEFVTESFSAFTIVWTSGGELVTKIEFYRYTGTDEWINNKLDLNVSGIGELRLDNKEIDIINEIKYGVLNQYMQLADSNGVEYIFKNAQLIIEGGQWPGEQIDALKYVNGKIYYRATDRQIWDDEWKDLDQGYVKFSVCFLYKEAGDELPTVGTVDNDRYGIKMRLIDHTDGYGNNTISAGTVGNGANGLILNNTEAVVQNLVQNKLQSGYPILSNGQSLAQLFSGGQEANHLFIEDKLIDEGYFEYNSSENYAYLDGKDFKVYDVTGTPKHPGTTSNDSYGRGNFFPYNDIDPDQYLAGYKSEGKDLYLTDGVNYFFGMYLEAAFAQPANGRVESKLQEAKYEDMVYKFTGDDDLWVFIDDVLVLDLGGIHNMCSGEINFANGEVKIQGSKDGSIKDKYKEAGLFPDGSTWNDNPEEINKYFTAQGTFVDYSGHTLKMFYMERGAGASNLQMKMNIPVIPAGLVQIQKQLDNTDKEKYKDVEFAFQIFAKKITGKDANGNEIYGNEYVGLNESEDPSLTFYNGVKFDGDNNTYDNVFYLKPGEIARFMMQKNREYYVREIGVKSEEYDKVTVNKTEYAAELDKNGNLLNPFLTAETTSIEAGKRPIVIYTNTCSGANSRELHITKQILNGQQADVDDRFTFKVTLGGKVYDGPYYLTDSEGNYYKEIDGTLVGQGKIAVICKEDSPGGVISNIPAGCTVSLTQIMSDTTFKVEEVNPETETYTLVGITGKSGTYTEVTNTGSDSKALNGKILLGRDAEVTVTNALKNVQTSGLSITKKLKEGSPATDASFAFHVYQMVNGNFEPYEGDYSVGGGTKTVEDGKISIKADETAVIEMPAGTQFRVEETLSEGYGTPEITVTEGTVAVTEISENTVEGTVSEGQYAGITVTNVPAYSYDWQIVKKGTAESSKPLKGAEFTLTLKSSQGEKKVYYGKSQKDSGVIWWFKDNSYKEGEVVNISDIAPGEYVLEETKAPTGYMLSNDKWDITLAYGSITVKDAAGEMKVEPTEDNGRQKYEYIFLNEAVYELPSTGGIGIHWYMVSGTLLMMAGILILYKRKYAGRC